MRTIEKRTHGPSCLAEARKTPDASASLSTLSRECMQEVQVALVEDQGGLCAYCMGRIRPSSGRMKIEHWEARSKTPERAFDWQNLLGVCLGWSRGERHCDEAKADHSLTVHPADHPADVSRLFRFTGEGEIRPAEELDESTRRTIENDLAVLNLNAPALKTNRAEVRQVLRDELKKGDFRRNLARLRDRYLRPEPPERLEPYCQVAIQYLEKLLRRHGLRA